MLFATEALAARIERADSRLLADALAHVLARGEAGQAFVRELAGGVAAYTEAGSPLNKVAGLGFEGAVEDADLDALEADFAARECPVQIEVATLADPSLARRLTARGYRLVGFENVLGRRLPADDLPEVPEVEVALSPPDDLDAWLDVVAAGFAAPDPHGVPSHETFDEAVLRRIVRDFVQAEGVSRYAARLDGAYAGGGAMRAVEAVAQLCGAATLREFRGRGVQNALLAERLRIAARSGCDLAVVTAQPGSTSQHNAQRKGFALLYSRAVLVLG